MSTAVFAGHSQEELNALLDTRRRVPDHASYTDRFERRSEQVRQDCRCELDIRYGEHPRQRLDLFRPPGSGPVPINVFFHGGYWRAGTKERYAFLAETFTAAGVACGVAEYALVPAVELDELIRQCRTAVATVFFNAERFGVDRSRIYVSGHSAGAQIVGMLMAEGWQEPLGLPASVVRGGCGISGLYDLEPIRLSYLNAELGLSPDDDVVVYCRIGERSSHTWFVLQNLLGYPTVRNYDGSWTEWGNAVRTPIEKGAGAASGGTGAKT